MWVLGTLFFATSVLLNSIELSTQTSSSDSTATSKPYVPPGPAHHAPQPQSPIPTKGASGSTPKQPVHRGPAHSAPQPRSPTSPKGASSSTPKQPVHRGPAHSAPQPNLHPDHSSSSSNPPGGPPRAPNKGSSSQPKPNPDLGDWPQILKPNTRVGPGSSSARIPTGFIRLDENYKIIGRFLSQLGFARLIPNDYLDILLEFRKYTFSPAQGLVLYYNTKDKEGKPIPASEQIVIVNAENFALAILMPKGTLLGMYVGNARTGRRKVHTITNLVDKFVGDEIKHVLVGIDKVLPSPRYGIKESEINSLLDSYGRKGGAGITPQPPQVPTHDPPSPGRPAKRPRQNP